MGGARGPGPGRGLVTPGGESGHPEQGQDSPGVRSKVHRNTSVAVAQSIQLLTHICNSAKLQLFVTLPSCVRSSAGPVQEAASHAGMKDSKVVWVGEGRILTSGFGADRARELIIRDVRNIASPQKVLSLDVSSGILVPLHDPDTNMVFLCGKGDR